MLTINILGYRINKGFKYYTQSSQTNERIDFFFGGGVGLGFPTIAVGKESVPGRCLDELDSLCILWIFLVVCVFAYINYLILQTNG